MEARFTVNAPHVIHETIDGEVIIINLASGNYYSVKGSGAQIWHLIQTASSTSVAQISGELERLVELPADGVEASVARFVEELQAEDLITAAPGGDVPTAAAVAANGTGERVAFAQPVLEKYTDMVDLVLLDPVHEVAETGWPKQQHDAAVAEPSA